MIINYNINVLFKMDRRKFLTYISCGCCGCCPKWMFNSTYYGQTSINRLFQKLNLNAQAAQIYEKIKEKEKLSDDKNKLNEIIDIGK